MKNSAIYYFFTFLVFIISCNEIESIPPKENPLDGVYAQEIQELENFYLTGLDLVVERLDTSFPPSLSGHSNFEEKLFMDILNGLNEKIFHISEDEINNYSLRMQNLLISKNKPDSRIQQPGLNDAGIFNSDQILMSENFVEQLLQTDDPYSAKKIANSFENEILKSSLNYEEKISLLSLSRGTIAVSDFMINDGIGKVRDKINRGEKDEIQVYGCSINMRNVWSDAVVSFAGGAVAGCYAGATAGTVAFPLFGTATGCVSAGMVGGAGGFISGASYSIVSGLLLSCFR
jgi:hypothetical protein